jgi:hypothetical protein
MEDKKKFVSKLGLDKYQFEYCAELIWGGVPVDRDWAEDSKLFLEKYKGLLEKYNPEEEKAWRIKLKQLNDKI